MTKRIMARAANSEVKRSDDNEESVKNFEIVLGSNAVRTNVNAGGVDYDSFDKALQAGHSWREIYVKVKEVVGVKPL